VLGQNLDSKQWFCRLHYYCFYRTIEREASSKMTDRHDNGRKAIVYIT